MIRTAAQILAEIGDDDAWEDGKTKQPRRSGRPPLHRKCSFAWCGQRHHGNDYCKFHNWSLLHYGDPLATSRVGNPPRQEDAHRWPRCTRQRGRRKR
jgi:hypothetical protein